MPYYRFNFLLPVKKENYEPIKEKKPFFDFSVLKSPAIMQMLIGSAVIYAALFSLQPIFPLYIAGTSRKHG